MERSDREKLSRLILGMMLPGGPGEEPSPYIPGEKQAEAHASSAKYRWLCGGMGGGKTLWLCAEALATAMEFPGSKGLIARFGYRELRETTWETLKSIIPEELLASPILESSQAMRIRLWAPGGQISTIIGWNGSNWKNLTSLNLDWFAIDEVTEYPNDDVWKQLTGRLRGKIGPRRGFCGGTPAGHDWCYQKFVQKRLKTYECFQIRTKDNPTLPEGYEEDLRSSNSSEWCRRFLDAQFNLFEGSVYYPWDEAFHVIDEFPIPSHWPKYLGIDPGLRDPCAALVVTVDEDGNHYLIDEHFKTEQTIRQQCDELLVMTSGMELCWTAIDPNSGEQRSDVTGQTRFEMYQESGIKNLRLGRTSLADTIARVVELLRIDPQHRHPITEEKGSPRLFVFRRKCPNFRREIAGYRYGRTGKPEDRDNHTLDTLRYILACRPQLANPHTNRDRNEWWQHFLDEIDRDGTIREPVIGGAPGGDLAYA